MDFEFSNVSHDLNKLPSSLTVLFVGEKTIFDSKDSLHKVVYKLSKVLIEHSI